MTRTVIIIYILVILFAGLWVGTSDAQTYIKNVGLIQGQTVTATAAGTTTLTKDSQTRQVFTGSTTQTVTLPDATTLPVGREFQIFNQSTGNLTINTNGGSLLKTVTPGTVLTVSTQTVATAAGTWTSRFEPTSAGVLPLINGGTNKAATASAGSVAYSDSDSYEFTAVGSSGQVLVSQGTSAPIWSTQTFPTSIGTVPCALIANTANTVTCLPMTTANRVLLTTDGSTISAGRVDIATAQVQGVLPIANGGSNKALTLSNGGMLWTDTDSFEVLAAGTSGQILTSGGAATPAWVTVIPIANGGTNNGSLGVSNGSAYYGDGSKLVALAPGSSGQVYTSGGAGAPTWTTTAATTYTPTLTNGTNVSASSADTCEYIRFGSVVVVGCRVGITCTLAALTATNIGISLPIASNLAASSDLNGNIVSAPSANEVGAAAADTTNDRADVNFACNTTGSLAGRRVMFIYQIL